MRIASPRRPGLETTDGCRRRSLAYLMLLGFAEDDRGTRTVSGVPRRRQDMRIAQIAPPFETVPPSRYGGTERVVSTLTEELVQRGHDVTLFAAGGSQTSARLIPTVERALWYQQPRPKDYNPYWALTLGEVSRHITEFDVIHSHLDFFGYPMARAGVRPVVSTLHGRLDLPDLQALYRHYVD